MLAVGAGCAPAPIVGALGSSAGQCLPVDRIDHADVPDDRTILFVMKDRTVWRNDLQATCPGLQFSGFAYAPVVDLVCGDKQTIRVLQSDTVCSLGPFSLQRPAP